MRKGRPPIRPVDELQVNKVFFDSENPNSLVNRVWVDFVPYLRAVADVYPTHLLSNENIVKGFCNPDERDQRVRLKFWDEYYQATAQDRLMVMHQVTYGACSIDVWNQVFLPDRRKLLWVITQPATYTTSMRSLLDKGLERLHEIMEMPLMRRVRGGVLEPDIRMITQVLKAFQLVDLRVKGSVVHRMQIDQRNINLNHNVDADRSSLVGNLSTMSIEQLREMERHLDRIAEKRGRIVEMLPEGERGVLEAETSIDIPRAVDFAEEVEHYGEEEEQDE